jgi:hypothetical protein
MTRNVIYSRYSSDMQRTESCADQERDVRRDLPRFGVSGEDFLIIRDEAESGTRSHRDGFQQLQAMIARGEVALLAVDDQSRLSRANNAFNFIQDLVYAGGRFISTGEGIDTNQKGWELRVKVMELHNSTTIRELGNRVYCGQEGRVLDDGSAGDYPFGYESYFLDPEQPLHNSRRGPKPKKGLRICEAEAQWVRQIFAWFIDGVAIREIARRLTRSGAPKDHRSSKPGWHHQMVRGILGNDKYIGCWSWGETKTIRNSTGRKKQGKAEPEKHIVRDRPHLRIIEQDVWEKAQRRLAELDAKFGSKAGQKKRGPKVHPSAVYPQSLLGGILVCATCGAKLWQHHSNRRRYYACPNHNKGSCTMASQVPAEKAEQALCDHLTQLLCSWPQWLAQLYRRVRELVQERAQQVPVELQQVRQRLAEIDRRLQNLVDALADGQLTAPAIRQKLTELQEEHNTLTQRRALLEASSGSMVALPDDAWMAERLCDWAGRLRHQEMQQVAQALRQAVTAVRAEAVVAPGKKRGFIRLRFGIRGWDLLQGLLGESEPGKLLRHMSVEGPQGASTELTLDLGEPTPMDHWGPQIVAWRTEGVKWEESVQRTGLDLNRAYIAWKRHLRSPGPGASGG